MTQTTMRRSSPRPSTLPSRGSFVRDGACAGGFTLVEMLVVIAIILILSVLAVPALTSLNKSTALNSSGRLLIGLLSVARSEAIARRTVVRLEVATAWPDPSYNYRKMTLTTATLNAGGTAYTYRQLGKWETLNEGVVFETHDPLSGTPPDGSVYLLAATPDAGVLSFGGQDVKPVHVAFSSTGALMQPPSGVPVPLRARLVDGVVGASTTVTYTHRANGSTGTYPAANWLDVRVNHLIGRIEVGRPETPLP